MITGLHHLQLAMPPEGEGEARAFYGGLLGLIPVAKPADLAGRGGCWFTAGDLGVHLGVDEGFRPARKAHPAFWVEDLARLVVDLEAAGHVVAGDTALDGHDRVYVDDPFGNRLELVQAPDESGA